MYSSTPPPDSSYSASGGAYQRGYAPVTPRSSRPRLRLPTPSQWLLLGGGALTIGGAALPWWSLTLPAPRGSMTLALAGWTTAEGKAVAALGGLVLLLALVRLLRVPLPAALSARERLVYVALGGEALLLALLALLDGVHVFTSGGYIATSAGIGLYLTLAGSAAAIAGGVLHRPDAAWML